MKIRGKFILGISIILVTLGIVLNILITKILIFNLEKSINNSLIEVMNSTREYVKYRLITNATVMNEETLSQEAVYISKYIALNYKCDVQMSDMKGNITKLMDSVQFEETLKNSTNEAIKGKAIVNLNYGKQCLNGILSYPVCLEGKYLGVVTINKSYDDIYLDYKKIINLIGIIETGIFIVIFILVFIMTSRLTRPIVKLTKVVKEVSEGNYDTSLTLKGKDEIAILSKEFMSMKDKIKDQIETIRIEKEKVEKLEKTRRIFFDSVTHELKTPLTAISGYAEMLNDGMVKSEKFNKRATERIYSESERLHKLVLDLINVSKGVSFIEEEKSVVDMKKLLNQICEDMSIKAKKYDLIIERHFYDGYIYGRPNKIKELIINVVDNAIKYSLDGKVIKTNATIKDQSYVLEVINKGGPIEEEVFNNIFNPFVKSDNAKEKESRGLGLYISSEIVKDHEGTIDIENKDEIKIIIKIPLVNNLETSCRSLENK